MPSARQARTTRTATSPRFAIRRRRMRSLMRPRRLPLLEEGAHPLLSLGRDAACGDRVDGPRDRGLERELPREAREPLRLRDGLWTSRQDRVDDGRDGCVELRFRNYAVHEARAPSLLGVPALTRQEPLPRA